MEEYVKVSARTSYFVTKSLEPLQIQGFQVIFQPVTAHYRQLPFACPPPLLLCLQRAVLPSLWRINLLE